MAASGRRGEVIAGLKRKMLRSVRRQDACAAPMPSRRDPKLGLLAVFLAYLAGDRILPSSRTICHRTNYNATPHFGLASTAFLYVMRNQKSIRDMSEPCPVRGHRLIGPSD